MQFILLLLRMCRISFSLRKDFFFALIAIKFLVLCISLGTASCFHAAGSDDTTHIITTSWAKEKQPDEVDIEGQTTVEGTSVATTPEGVTPPTYRRLMPVYKNSVCVYVFPTVYAVALANNFLSFTTIVKSNIIKTSIGLYLAVLAWADCLAISAMASLWWSRPVFHQDFPWMRACNVNRFLTLFPGMLSSLCVLCITVDRFLAVWFPFKAKSLTSRKKATFVLLSIVIILTAVTSPLLIGLTPTCQVKWNPLRSYLATGVYVLLNILYSYGTSMCLLILNIAISIRMAFPDKGLRATQRNTVRSTKVVTTTLAVSFSFLICTLPYNFASSAWSARGYLTLDAYADEILLTIARLLGFLNHTINFYLYVLTSQNFRSTLFSIFSAALGLLQCSKRSQQPGESTFHTNLPSSSKAE